MRRAFTLIELILVIVILGIVGMMSFEMILNVYRNYAQSRAINTLETRTELALEQISKLLSYRIKESVIARESANFNNILPLSDSGLGPTYDVLEFIPYAYEAYNAGVYSGIADLSVSNPVANRNRLITPGSNLAAGVNMFGDLTNGSVNFDTAQHVGIIFKGVAYDVRRSFGYIGAGNLDMTTAQQGADDTTLILPDAFNGIASEQYHLAYTAYALAPANQDAARGDFTLNLHYNYRPWLGNRYNNASVSPIAQNVTQFNFTEQNGVVVLKLCLRDGSGDNSSNFVVCKTKAVY